jgi:hypothetical protein
MLRCNRELNCNSCPALGNGCSSPIEMKYPRPHLRAKISSTDRPRGDRQGPHPHYIEPKCKPQKVRRKNLYRIGEESPALTFRCHRRSRRRLTGRVVPVLAARDRGTASYLDEAPQAAMVLAGGGVAQAMTLPRRRDGKGKRNGIG